MAEETEKPEQQLDEVRDCATQNDFKMKNKVKEMIQYGNPVLGNFPKSERMGLALQIKNAMYDIMHHVIRLENKTFKKTTLGDLDTELDWLRQCLQIAQDKESFPNKKPCISVHQYEVWSRKVNEIGKMIGGYYNSLNPQKPKKR